MAAPEPNRGGRPPRHGVHALAQQLGVGRRPDAQRLERRTSRALNRLQRQLDANPLETIRDHLVDGIACDTIIEQKANRELLASAELRNEQGLAKFKFWIGNRLDRQRDQLILLERQRAAKAVPSLDDYIAARSNGHAPSPTPAPSTGATTGAAAASSPAVAAPSPISAEPSA